MRRHRGFTLVEMIMTMVILGIISGMVAIFIARPVEGYIATARRAQLTDMADLAMKRLGLEIRTAVPNSVRLRSTTTTGLTSCLGSATNSCYIEFLPILDGGRYCNDRNSECNHSQRLLFNGSDKEFRVLGRVPTVGAKDDYLIVFNTGQNPDLDAYTGNNRRLLDAPVAQDMTISDGLTHPSPSNRFQIVSATEAPVTFACLTPSAPVSGSGTGALRRYSGYVLDTDQPMPVANEALLADLVSACTIAYDQGNGLVTFRITLQSEGEAVTLVQRFHVDNMP